MLEAVLPSRKVLAEALSLTEEILKSIELSEGPLSNIMLKASRLARMLNDKSHQLAFEYEASGFPTSPAGISPDVFEIAVLAGRSYERKNQDGGTTLRAHVKSIEALESGVAVTKSMLATTDPNHTIHRNALQKSIAEDTKVLASSRGFVHRYVSRKYDELRFSGIADDIFSRIRGSVDERIGASVPKAMNKLAAIYENLASDNPEDWANAVHGCRRMLQDLADVLFPPRDSVSKVVRGKEIEIKLGHDNYINRLIAYVESRSDSDRFSAIVGSSLEYMGNRLDASFAAAQKGSHSEIATQAEADRYFVYTYMLVADLLSLS